MDHWETVTTINLLFRDTFLTINSMRFQLPKSTHMLWSSAPDEISVYFLLISLTNAYINHFQLFNNCHWLNHGNQILYS